MAIVHDIAEGLFFHLIDIIVYFPSKDIKFDHCFWAAIVGDITPSCGIPKEEKNRRESEALEHMCKLLGGGERGWFSSLILKLHLYF